MERWECEGDRAKYLIKLTLKAKPAVKAIRKAYEELNSEALLGVNKADRAAFMARLMLVVKNLRPADEPVPVTTKRIHP